MNKKNRLKKELKKRETLAIELYGSTKYNMIEKNHKRIVWLRKYLGISNKPQKISVVELLLKRMAHSL